MFKNILKNQQGMSLSVMIALGFGAAVLVVVIVGLIVYFVKA